MTEEDRKEIEKLVESLVRETRGRDEAISFGLMARRSQEETGLPMTEVLEGCGVHYRTAMRYVEMSKAADWFVAEGRPLPPSPAEMVAEYRRHHLKPRRGAKKAQSAPRHGG